MADLARMHIVYTGWDGAPGVNVLHFSPGTTTWDDEAAQDLVDELATSWLAMRDLWPNIVVANVDTTMKIIDSETGTLTAVYNAATDPGAIAGTGTGTTISRATQACAQLRTSEFVRGRQLRGRVFIGPLANESIASDGALASGVASVITDGFAALVSGLGPRLCVWSRPLPGPAEVGTYGDVVTVGTMAKPAVLRSRRD